MGYGHGYRDGDGDGDVDGEGEVWSSQLYTIYYTIQRKAVVINVYQYYYNYYNNIIYYIIYYNVCDLSIKYTYMYTLYLN